VTLGISRLYCRIAIHIGRALVKLLLGFPLWSGKRRRHEIARWSAQALGIFGIATGTIGRPPQLPVLFVANHVSWLDILVILSHFDVVFVAKEEVRRWPVLGFIVARVGTVFVARRRSRQIPSQVSACAQKLVCGTSVCVFPEGTSSDGSDVLPFRSSLLQAAMDAGVAVQPLAISYRHPDGSRATEAAFTGDMSLIGSFRLLARHRSIAAQLQILPLILSAFGTRATIAQCAESSLRRALRVSGYDPPGPQQPQAADGVAHNPHISTVPVDEITTPAGSVAASSHSPDNSSHDTIEDLDITHAPGNRNRSQPRPVGNPENPLPARPGPAPHQPPVPGTAD